MENLHALLRKRDLLTGKINLVAKQEFGALVAGIFEKEPALKNFGWWNATEDCYNDGAVPGLGNFSVNVEIKHGYVDTYYSEAEDKALEGRVGGYLKDWIKDDMILHVFPCTSRYDSETIVVFPDRIETYDSPGY